MNRAAWKATVHGDHKESNMTEQLIQQNNNNIIIILYRVFQS